MKKTRISQMTADTAMLLYGIAGFVVDHGTEDSRELREYILDWLGKKGYVDRIYETGRSEDKVVEDFKKHFKVEDQRDTRHQDDKA